MPSSNSFKEELKKLEGMLNRLSTKKSSEKKDSSKKDHNFEEAEKFIREKFEVSKRDLDQIKKFYPDRYNAWLSSVSDQLGVKSK